MGIRQDQKAKRKKDILSKGLDLFISKGYTATKISDIAEKVEMSNGLFFHYFPNTEKLYEELVTIGLSATKNIMNNTDIPAISFFENIAKFLIEEIDSSSITSKMFVLMNLALRSDDTPLSVREIVSKVDTHEKMSVLIEKGQAEGTIKPGSSIALANTFLSCLTGIAEQKVTSKNMILPEPSWIVDIIRK